MPARPITKKRPPRRVILPNARRLARRTPSSQFGWLNARGPRGRGFPEVITRRRRQERQASGPILPPLPQPTDLLDPDNRERACVAVIDRSEIGGRKVLGRKRPSGRRSWTWKPVLWAPELNPHPEIRGAERTFIMWLQIAWRDATGMNVPVTAHPDNPGPFARLAQKALALLGAPHADAVQLINDLERTRNDLVTSQDLKDPPDSSG